MPKIEIRAFHSGNMRRGFAGDIPEVGMSPAKLQQIVPGRERVLQICRRSSRVGNERCKFATDIPGAGRFAATILTTTPSRHEAKRRLKEQFDH